MVGSRRKEETSVVAGALYLLGLLAIEMIKCSICFSLCGSLSGRAVPTEANPVIVLGPLL